MSLTTEIASLLSTVSNVYIGNMPATPDACACIYPTGGYPRDLSGSQYEEPTFMVKVRSATYAAGETTCGTIKDLLHGKTSGNFLCIYQQGDIQDLGRDENNRPQWSINFRCYHKR